MKRLILLIAALLTLLSCSSHEVQNHLQKSQTITAAGKTADFLQTTHDHNGDIIAWWVEKDQNSGEKFVYFSRSPGANLLFKESHTIPTSRRVHAGGEHMPKLVVKPDGTYVLIFARLNKDSDASFASSVLYTQTFDGGSTWTKPNLIHSDTDPDNSHGFHEAILLPDGEVGAVWLDGRHHLDHSTLYFAKTNGRQGFGKDKIIGGPGCQCCKLDMYVDDSQVLHLVYRGLSENNVRDIQHIFSTDNGNSFSTPSRVSDDNWQIIACPHNGPSVTQANNSLYVTWYTQGGQKGLYYAKSEDNGRNFSPRTRLTEGANHPYIASLGHSVIAIWDGVYQDGEEMYRRVNMNLISDEEQVNSIYLSPLNAEAFMPYLLEMKNGGVIATWTQNSEDGNELHFQKFSKDQIE